MRRKPFGAKTYDDLDIRDVPTHLSTNVQVQENGTGCDD